MLTADRLAIEAARAADDKKALDVRIMDMRKTLGITDYFLIASGMNDRHVRRIKDAVEEKLLELGAKPARREGERWRRWILLDYIDLVVHIFSEEDRQYYDLERLWGDVPRVEWREPGAINT